MVPLGGTNAPYLTARSKPAGASLLSDKFYFHVYAKQMGAGEDYTHSYGPVTHTSLFKWKQAQMSTWSFGLRGSLKISPKSSYLLLQSLTYPLLTNHAATHFCVCIQENTDVPTQQYYN